MPRKYSALALFILCGSATSASANDEAKVVAPRLGVLNLRSGEVNTAGLTDQLAGDQFAERRVVLMLSGPMTPRWRDALVAAGVKLHEYLPTNSWTADVSDSTPASLRALGFVRTVHSIDPAWKIATDLGTRAYSTPERQQLALAGRAMAWISLHPMSDTAGVIAAVNKLPDARVLWISDEGGIPTVAVELAVGDAAALSAVPEVSLIDDFPEFTARNNTVRWIVQTNRAGQVPVYTNGLTGATQVVAVIDLGFDLAHCMFADTSGAPFGPTHRKVLAQNGGFITDSHGTHCAGTLAGDNGTNDDRRGVAYGAKMVFNTYPSRTESSMYSRLDLHRTQGATIHSNSYGNDTTVDYDGVCRSIDNFSWINDEQLVVFAVTNGSLLRNPENAKNCLAVSAVGDAGGQNTVCSGGAGPTLDGRRKPEIAGPGCNVMSAAAGTPCGTASSSGTSMACPAVSGAATLVREYFTSGYYPTGAAVPANAFVPSGALVKACIINSGSDVVNTAGFPSAREGFGRLTIDNALFFPGDAPTLIAQQSRNNAVDALSTGGVQLVRFKVTGSSINLKATLAYHDAPAAVFATLTPVNNLDLAVMAPDGSMYLGNVFAGGVSVMGGAADALNNVEQVMLSGPAIGIWTARISAPAVNVGTQGYGLAITGELASLCLGDFNGDGFHDGFDYDDFVVAFEAGGAGADFNADGFVDGFDYDDYVGAFEAGC